MTLEQVHTGAQILALLLVLLAAWQWRAVLGGLRSYFSEPGSATALGALRVFIFYAMFGATEPGATASHAGLPSRLRSFPYGWGELGPYLPWDPTAAAALERGYFIACALSIVGLFTRITAPVAALLSVYVLGLPNFFLKVNHANQALTLIALILAVSPCGDGLSLDRLWLRLRGHAPPELANRYALPIRMSWLILGTVYLFPGLAKLWESGDLWISGAQLKAEIHTKWAQVPDFRPLFRVDESQPLLAALGTATLVFEIGFLFAVFNRYTRVLAAFSGVAFHWSIWQLMAIRFHIWLPLILLCDLPGLTDLVRKHAPGLVERISKRTSEWSERIRSQWEARLRAPSAPFPRRRPAVLAAVIGAVLFTSQVAAGAAKINSWPITIFPTFSERRTKVTDTFKRIQLVLEPANGGESKDLNASLQHFGKARMVRLMRRLVKVRNSKELEKEGAVIVSLFRSAGIAVATGDRITLYVERWDLFPLGERANYRRKTKARYEVTPTGSLAKASKR